MTKNSVSHADFVSNTKIFDDDVWRHARAIFSGECHNHDAFMLKKILGFILCQKTAMGI